MAAVVKFVELKRYKPDWDAKQMAESEGIAGHYVTSEQVCELEEQHLDQLADSLRDRRREREALESRISQLQFALQQAQGGR